MRIDTAKAYKVEVEKQAQAIQSRLDDANAPFQVLIDEYTAERKKILDAKKANEAALELKAKIEDDHEMALLMNKTWAYDREELLREAARVEAERLAEREVYATEQVKKAEQRQLLQSRARRTAKDLRRKRTTSKQGVYKGCEQEAILDVLEENRYNVQRWLCEVIKLAAKGLLPKLTINY